MKNLIFITFYLALIPILSFGAVLNLGDGETATINPNQTTTVTCNVQGGNSPDCNREVAFLKKNIDLCIQNTPTSTCLDIHWPKFKQRAPKCIQDGFDTCYSYCNQVRPSNHCVNFCN